MLIPGVHPLFGLLIVVLVAGFLAWVIGKLPFVEPQFKSVAQGILLFFLLLFVLFTLYAMFFGGRVAGRF
jgi:hypothetical protein